MKLILRSFPCFLLEKLRIISSWIISSFTSIWWLFSFAFFIYLRSSQGIWTFRYFLHVSWEKTFLFTSWHSENSHFLKKFSLPTIVVRVKWIRSSFGKWRLCDTSQQRKTPLYHRKKLHLFRLFLLHLNVKWTRRFKILVNVCTYKWQSTWIKIKE